MNDDLKAAIYAAKCAGKFVRDNYETTKTISVKGKHDFATNVDIEAERIIFNALKPHGYSFLGEESGETSSSNKKQWIVDPIDGTSNYICGIPFFAISIGLMSGNKLVLGVVYDPLRDECYWAHKGSGSYLNGQKLRVSNTLKFGESFVLIEHGRSDKAIEKYIELTKHLMTKKGTAIMRQGSTALMLCYVAKGSSPAFISYGDELYDYVAGLLIAEEAGAKVTDWVGQQWNNSSSYILASTPSVQDEIIDRVKLLQS